MVQIEIKGMTRLLSVLDWAIAQFDNITDDALLDIAKQIEEKAKELAPVRTGALRDSITAQDIGQLQVAISMLYYGIFQELGTSKIPPRPFVRPAIEQTKAELSKLMWNHLGKLFHK